ncbi:MAG: LD-carboxypeptidase, partial [Gammaproteobacteria bacterium]|nr:LD-carboxypeptidase [Gammaproteobacteria bacterium]
MEHILKAPCLRRGDTVGVVSPSWGGAALFPHRVEAALRQLQDMGLRVKMAPHALGNQGYIAASPQQRAADINAMFADTEVRAVLCTIGGDHSNQVLRYIDFDVVRRNPKVWMGFSDITVLNIALWQETGLVTFNGPCLLTDFAEYPRMLDYTTEYFSRTVMTNKALGRISPAPEWTEEFLDWGKRLDLTRPRKKIASGAWHWLKPGRARGRLMGGCIESLHHLRGTRFWPSWKDRILFIETSEEKPTPARIDSWLTDFENMGVLAQLRGILVGRAMRYSNEEKRQLRAILVERT